MTKEEIKEMAVSDGLRLFADFYDEAIIGFSDSIKVIYSYDKMIECYMKYQECEDEQDAIDWVEYNEIGSVSILDVIVATQIVDE